MYVVFLFLLVLKPFPLDTGPRFDAYDPSISIKQENERLDNFAIQIKNYAGSRGLIAVYAESEKAAASVKARARRAARYLVKTRGVNPVRVMWRYEAACAKGNLIILYLLDPDRADIPRDTKCLR
jgi:hypothetical protein